MKERYWHHYQHGSMNTPNAGTAIAVASPKAPTVSNVDYNTTIIQLKPATGETSNAKDDSNSKTNIALIKPTLQQKTHKTL